MEDIQIFIVFHKFIFDECYSVFPEDVLYKYFTFIAVNEKIEKKYTKKYKVINEWELPIYDKTFQERGYNENSAIYHIYINNIHKNYKNIGFFQYDMKFNNNIIDLLKPKIQTPTLFSLFSYDFNVCAVNTWNEKNTLDFILNDYEKFYNKKLNTENRYPLFNSYIIPIETYEKIMIWVIQLYDKLYPWCVNPPNKTHYAHIGGIYERIMAFAIGSECLNEISIGNIINHSQEYKNLCY